MTRWIALFEDHPEDQVGWIRKQHAKDHFDYLCSHADLIKIAGGLRSDPDEWWSGGLWVMEVASRDEAAALCEDDPFFKLGLRKGYVLRVWGKAPIYGDVML